MSTEEHDDRSSSGIWVTSDLNPDGSSSYIVTVSVNNDVALSLKADAAVRYVTAVYRAAVMAEHDAAVMRQLCARLGLDRKTAGMAILDLRDDREPVQVAATSPLKFEPIISASLGNTMKRTLSNPPPAARERRKDSPA